MKVLLAGGIKTQNIADGLNNKFASGGVDFIVVKYIEDIENIFSRGEYYDRALLVEQCWTNDSQETDERVIRQRINDFANAAASRDIKGINFIFLMQSEHTAAMVHEEILALTGVSVVVVKPPRYSVNFFASLVTCDIEQFPEKLVYKPFKDLDEVVEDKKEVYKVVEDTPDVVFNTEELADISMELFNIEENEAPGLEDYDKGVDVVLEGEQDDYVDDSDIWEGLFDTEIEDTIEVEDAEDDILIDDEIDTDISGAIPEFSRVNQDENQCNIVDSVEEKVYAKSGDIDGDVPECTDDYNIYVEEEQLDKSGDVGSPYEESIPEYIDDSLYEEEASNIKIPVDIEQPEVKEVSSKVDDEELLFEDTIYKDTNINTKDNNAKFDFSDENIKATLDTFASRGNSIAVTGCGGCGTSTVAYQLANTIANAGYTVLLIDMDTHGRAQSYISKDSYNCVETNGANLMQALKSSAGINAYVSIVRPGFRLLTMGLGGDIVPLEKIVQTQKLSRFINLAKTSHNFVIYDIPFNDAVGCAEDVMYMADNIVLVSDASNWGTTKTLLSVCNVESEDMQETLFSKAQILFNRCGRASKIMGKKVKSTIDIARAMDSKLREILGEDTGYYFKDMQLCNSLDDIQELEEGWYSKVQYTDSDKGYEQFLRLLINIVLRK